MKEAVSGTELVGPMGPAYGGDGSIPNTTLNRTHTDLIFSNYDGNFYSIDDFKELLNDYHKKGGPPTQMDFTENNIATMLEFLNKNI